MSVFAVLCFIGILVFVHETGHFLVGKLCGIGVEIYSIGFGPQIFSFHHKGTDYQICLLPLGGFVKFAGALRSEDVPERFKGKEMFRAGKLARAATILAGPMANLLLAAIIFTFAAFGGIKHYPPLIGYVLPGSPADHANFLAGDQVVSINGVKTSSWDDLRKNISLPANETKDVNILRNGKNLKISVIPETRIEPNELGEQTNSGRIGISYGFIPAIVTPLALLSNQDKNNNESFKLISPGDQLIELAFIKNEKTVDSISIKQWSDFLDGLNQAQVRKVESIELVLKTSESFEKKDQIETKSTKKIRISTKIWQNQSIVKKSHSLGESSKRELLANSLGLYDSQLTIGEVLDPLRDKILFGDRLIKIEDEIIHDIFSLSNFLQKNQKPQITLEVIRNGQRLKVLCPLTPVEIQKVSGKATYYKFDARFLGQAIPPEPYIKKYENVFSALSYGLYETYDKSKMIVSGIYGLITGTLPLKALGGPVLIAKVAGDAVKAGWEAFFGTMALISINLGVLNLFPIPALDGGQLLLVCAEAIKRKPLSEEALENFQRIGFVMILALMVLATYNDLSRFWTSMLRSLSEMF